MALIKLPNWKKSVSVKRNLTTQELKEVTTYFNNLVLFVLLKLNYTQFLIKAKGGVDRYGGYWKPLSKKTIDYKRRKGFVYSGKVAINIRTRELLNAVKPNQFSNGVYIPSPNQKVKVTSRSIHFEIDLEYAEDVDRVRAILVEDLNALTEDAIEVAMPRFQQYLNKRIR